MKSITVQDLVNRFHLEILAGHSQLHRTIDKARVHRPGLEFFSRSSASRCLDEKKLRICTSRARRSAIPGSAM
ncbi:MAG: serine kinase [Paenibacillus sp.]|nr:serine kinase [Paenibacillus sp.]